MKNYLLTFSLLLTLIGAHGQSGPFVLKGKIAGQSSGKLKLSYPGPDGKFMQDSTIVKNGAFEFNGNIAEPVMAYIADSKAVMTPQDPNMATFFMEPEKMTIALIAGDFKKLKVSGSTTQDEYARLELRKKIQMDQIRLLSDAYGKLNSAYLAEKKAGTSEVELEKLKEKANLEKDKMEPIMREISKMDMEFIKSHPNSYYSAFALRLVIPSLPISESKSLYATFSDRVKQSSYGKEIVSEIKRLEGGSPGAIANLFVAQDINGEQLNLAHYKGKKYLLLDFWASWCVPCRKGNPHLLSLYSKYKNKGLEIVGVSDDDSNIDAWKMAVVKDKIGVWKQVLRGLKRVGNDYDKTSDLNKAYAIHTLPTKILIDKDGVIIGRYGGGGEDDAAMDKKLASIFESID